MTFEDTIVAIATPPGRGGIGVVRLSGPDARAIAEPILRLTHPLSAGRARFAKLLDPAIVDGSVDPAVLDEVVVTFFAAPHSYTSEDVVEVSMHGAPVLLGAVVRYALSRGARLAAPGEFTQRAYRSGRLDLTAAEAVRDLIDALTLDQARTAAAQLGGSISRAIAPAKRDLVTLIATMEAGIDFAEDDIDTLSSDRIVEQVQQAASPLEVLAKSFSYGRILREGVMVALAGRPNAGKSSLFNRLLGRDRAIVTAQPGTTRDLLSESFLLGTVPVELIDTAGLRELSGAQMHEAERAGIERTRTTMAEAHHVLLIVDAAALKSGQSELSREDQGTLLSLEGRPKTLVFNKVDLLASEARVELASAFPEAIFLSSLTGAGFEDLRGRLYAHVEIERPLDDTILVTSMRQQAAIEQCLLALRAAASGAAHVLPHEIILLDLHSALAALDQLTGETSSDAVLGEIFATFCIGK